MQDGKKKSLSHFPVQFPLAFILLIVVVQSFSHVQLSMTPWTAACQASLSFTISRSLLKLMSIELVILSNHLILCWHLLLLPSVFPSNRVFSNESVLCISWPKYWSFSFSISPSNDYSGLIFFRIDCFDLLAVQRTLRSLLQHHSSKASILWDSRGVTPRLRSRAAARVPGCNGAGTAEKSYPSPRSGAAAAERRYPTPSRWRPGAAARRTNPTSKEQWLPGCRRA